ncbi:hypothetical protein BDN70DRAFT_251276 [Pholiota conissans]|uniref:Uncharacterized protein n=1 Tax=Pholiota conissans TaxID=109636 RepID=A0A9P5YTQ1_9AGAR|nr:hypothetical protein BDN70DRAFT_251276 [Pholiota conissans]
MKDEGDRIVAVDFGGYSFLPVSFFAFALTHSPAYSSFAWDIARMPRYPSAAAEVGALASASGAMVPFNTNNIGLPKELKSRLHAAHKPPPRLMRLCFLFQVLATYVRCVATCRTSKDIKDVSNIIYYRTNIRNKSDT